MDVESIKHLHAESWKHATIDHPFLMGCAEGSISQTAFDTWLVQDYFYVQSFLIFTQTLKAKSTRPEDAQVFQGSLETIADELKWFEAMAAERGLDLVSAATLATTHEYAKYLGELGEKSVPFAIHAAAFYYTEAVYNSAWARVLEKQGPEGKFSRYASRWGSAEFTAYCGVLLQIAEAARTEYLAAGHSAEEYTKTVSQVAENVFRLEIQFWSMAQDTIRVIHSITRLDMIVAVGSTNPVKVSCVQSGLSSAFPLHSIECIPLNVSSGVSDQPFSNRETRDGAQNRAIHAYQAFYDLRQFYPDFAVGVEGGVCDEEDVSLNGGGIKGDLYCFAWIVIFNGSHFGRARTSSFILPPSISKLVHEGIELGKADDVVFGRTDSKRGNGTVGYLTENVITRKEFYVPAVILACIPFKHKDLYFKE